MKQHYLHTGRNWQIKRSSTLASAYCFSSINVDLQNGPEDTGQSSITM